MKTIQKALDIIEIFLDNQNEMSFKDIVKISTLKRSTAHRVISVLKQRNYLKQHKKRGPYSLGIRMINTFRNTGNEAKRGEIGGIGYLARLSRLIHESVHMQIWHGSEIFFTKSISYSTNSRREVPNDWIRLPLHCTCNGKIALANLSDEDLKKYYYAKFFKRTPRRKVDFNLLKDELDKVKKEGIAFEEEECRLKVNGIAARLENGYGETVGTVFIVGSSNRLTHEVMLNLVPTIKICAENVSRELGYRA